MSITDELREWAKGSTLSSWTAEHLTAIADRIDAEHDKALNSADDAYDSGYNVGYDEGFASADDWLAQHEDAMAEHGWIRLPKDADGEYIQAGDVLDGYGKTIEVVELRYGRSGWVLISRDGNGYADTFAFTHHKPTVEDVLTEMFAKAIERGELTNGAAQTIAEYAAMLRLAGSDAE